MGGRAGGGARGGSGRAGGGVAGFPSAESVRKKMFEDNKFRVGVSKSGTSANGDTYTVTTTNAKLDGGGTLAVKSFSGNKDAAMKMANALKSGKTYNQAYYEATGNYING